jgi:hypothetical protein
MQLHIEFYFELRIDQHNYNIFNTLAFFGCWYLYFLGKGIISYFVIGTAT